MINGHRLGFLLWSWLLAQVPQAQHIIDLKAATLIVPGLHERIDSVVLAFDPLDPIGAVQKGGLNRLVPAYLNGPVDKALLAFLCASPQATSESTGLVIKVNTLQVNERTVKESGMASCALHLEILRRGAGAELVRVYAHGTNAVWRGAAVTGAHDRTVASAFEECLRGYVAARDGGRLEATPITLHELRSVTEDRAILAAVPRTPKRGLYHAYMDLVLDLPDTLTAFALEPRERSEGLREMRMKGDSALPVRKKIWGCSDGERRYVNVDGNFVQLVRDSAAIRSRVRFMDVDPEFTPGIVSGGAIFGAIGASAMTIASIEERNVPVHVDLLTGRLVADPERWSVEARQEEGPRARVLFVHSRYSKQDAPICVQGNASAGTMEAPKCIGKGQHHTVLLEPRMDAITLYASVGGQAPVHVVVDANILDTQVYLLKADKKGTVKADRLNEQMTQEMLHTLDDSKCVP